MRSRTLALLALGLGCLALVLLWTMRPETATTAPSETDPPPVQRALQLADAGARGERQSIASTKAPPWRLEGDVRTPDGAPIAEAHVEVHAGDRDAVEELGHATTGSDGSYRIDLMALRRRPVIDLARIELRVSAVAPRYLPLRGVELGGPGAEPGRELILRKDLILQPGGQLSGRVFDAVGYPVANAQVYLTAQVDGEGTRAQTATDATGSYLLGIAADGLYELRAHRDDVGWARHTGLALQTARDFAAPELVLRATASLVGMLVYEDGQPIADMSISARLDEADASAGEVVGQRHGRTRTAADGRFELRALQPGQYRLHPKVYVFEERDRYRPLIHTDRPATRVVMDLHRLRLRFEDEHGHRALPTDASCTGWRATAGALMRQLTTGTPLPPDWRKHPEWRKHFGISVAGWVQDLLVPKDSWWWISADADGLHADVVAQAGGADNETEVTLVLTPLQHTARLRLRVTDEHGDPITNVKVTTHQILPGQPDDLQPAGEEDGSLLFRSTPGRFQLDVQPRPKRVGDDYFEIEREVALHANSETVVECVAQLGGHVRLTVHLPGEVAVDRIEGFEATTPGAAGEPPRRLGPYVVHRPDGWIMGMSPPSEQPFTTRLLVPGRHQLTITAAGYQPASIAVLVEAGEVADAAVFLQPN